MLFCSFGIYEDVINVIDDKFVQLFIKDQIHKGFECCQNVTQPKKHDQELIQPILNPHHCLFNILIYYPNLIVPRLHINLAKISSPVEPIQQVVNIR